MSLYYHPASTASRPVLMLAGEPGLEAVFQGHSEQIATRSEERGPTGKLVEARRHPAIGFVARAIAACAFVAALFALIGGAIELALVL